MTKPTILVSTWGDGLFSVTGEGRTQEFANQPVRGLVSDGRGGVLAIVDKHSLRRKAPNGVWAAIAESEFELSCCICVRDTIYVGTDCARMLRLPSGGGRLEPIVGFDSVPGREAWYAGSAMVNGQRLGPPLGIRSVAANANGSVLFANVHVGGIPCSTDGGRTWRPTIDINSDVHEVRAHPSDPALVAAASSVGLCLSRDAGATWTIERDGLHDPHCYAIAFSGADILISASRDFFAGEGRIYRRPVNPDGSLTLVEGGRPAFMERLVDTGCIGTNGASVAVADRAGNLYGSEDFGRNWSCTSAGLPIPSGVLIC